MENKPEDKKPAAKKSETVEMKHRTTGKTAVVHKSMIEEYKKGEYAEVH